MDRSKIHIFISHASAGDPISCDALPKYVKALRDAGYTVEYDKDLPPGAWHSKLIDMMMRCHAAVVLLGKKAISNSAWVSCESFLMRVRHMNEPYFRIYPVCLDSVTKDEVCTSTLLQPSALRELTLLSDTNAVDTILSDLKDFKPPATFEEELQPFVELLRGLLDVNTNAALCETAFARAYEKLDRSYTNIKPEALRDMFVYHLTDVPLQKSIQAITELQNIETTRCVEAIAPLWLSIRRCEPLREALRSPAHSRVSGSTLFFHTLVSGQAYEVAAEYCASWLLARAIGYPLKKQEQSNKLRPQKLIQLNLDASCDAEKDALRSCIQSALCSELHCKKGDIKGCLESKLKRGHPEPKVIVLPHLNWGEQQREAFKQELLTDFPGIFWLEHSPHGLVPCENIPLLEELKDHAASQPSSEVQRFFYHEAECLEAFFSITGRPYLSFRGPYEFYKNF